MLTPANQVLAYDFKRLYDFSKEVGRCLTHQSADAVAMGVKNALHVLLLRDLSSPDAVAVALCEPEKVEAAHVPAKKETNK